MFYCFRLDKESQEICVISLEDGNYKYTRLPMGVKISPDIAQAHMTEMLYGIDCSVYFDDVGLWTDGTFEEHLELLSRILKKNKR